MHTVHRHKCVLVFTLHVAIFIWWRTQWRKQLLRTFDLEWMKKMKPAIKTFARFFFIASPAAILLFENMTFFARRRELFRGIWVIFLVAQLPPKRGVLAHKNLLASCQWCCHSVDPRALTCPFKQSKLSAWSLLRHPIHTNLWGRLCFAQVIKETSIDWNNIYELSRAVLCVCVLLFVIDPRMRKMRSSSCLRTSRSLRFYWAASSESPGSLPPYLLGL